MVVGPLVLERGGGLLVILSQDLLSRPLPLQCPARQPGRPTRQKKFSLDLAQTQIREYHHVGENYFKGIYLIPSLYLSDISDISPLLSTTYAGLPRKLIAQIWYMAIKHHKCWNTLHRVTSKLSVERLPRKLSREIRYTATKSDMLHLGTIGQ